MTFCTVLNVPTVQRSNMNTAPVLSTGKNLTKSIRSNGSLYSFIPSSRATYCSQVQQVLQVEEQMNIEYIKVLSVVRYMVVYNLLLNAKKISVFLAITINKDLPLFPIFKEGFFHILPKIPCIARFRAVCVVLANLLQCCRRRSGCHWSCRRRSRRKWSCFCQSCCGLSCCRHSNWVMYFVEPLAGSVGVGYGAVGLEQLASRDMELLAWIC